MLPPLITFIQLTTLALSFTGRHQWDIPFTPDLIVYLKVSQLKDWNPYFKSYATQCLQNRSEISDRCGADVRFGCFLRQVVAFPTPLSPILNPQMGQVPSLHRHYSHFCALFDKSCY